MTVHRYSNIATFSKCPFRYFNKVVLGVKQTNEVMALGSTVQRSISKIVETGLYPEDATVEAIKEIQKEEGIAVELNDVMWMVKRAVSILGKSRIKPLYVEKTIAVSLNTSDPFSPQVQGTMDLITDSRELWDWKTGRTKPDSMQLKVYAFLCDEVGIEVKRAGFVNLRKNEAFGIAITTREIEEAKEWLTVNVRQMEECAEAMLLGAKPLEAYQPKSNCYCDTCPYATLCIAQKEEKTNKTQSLDFEQITTLVQAQQIGAEILRLEGIVKNYKELLKGYVDKNGGVEVDSKVFDYSTSTSWNFTPESKKEMATQLLNHELDIWDYMDISADSRKKMFEKLNWAEDEANEFLKKYGTKNETKSFRCVAVK